MRSSFHVLMALCEGLGSAWRMLAMCVVCTSKPPRSSDAGGPMLSAQLVCPAAVSSPGVSVYRLHPSAGQRPGLCFIFLTLTRTFYKSCSWLPAVLLYAVFVQYFSCLPGTLLSYTCILLQNFTSLKCYKRFCIY